MRQWSDRRGELEPADHVAPGGILLEVAARHADAAAREFAGALARLLTSVPQRAGVALHRSDLPTWSSTIWVDCMALDGPFLIRYAHATSNERWTAAATEALTSYAHALHDRSSGLFHHSFASDTRRTNGVAWGRGNGWALHGLINTLEMLPETDPAHPALTELTRATLHALVALQHPDGRWHTVVNDPTTPLENATAAFFAAAILKALRLSIVAEVQPDGPLLRAAQRALLALARELPADGGLKISSATPVGDRNVYANQSLGVYPWGQGPLLLAAVEAARWNRAGEPG